MRDRFYYYCKAFKTTPKKMRKLLHRYFNFPTDIRELLLDEYHARKNGRSFKGRDPRPVSAIGTEFKLSQSEFQKMAEIHKSGLFPNIRKAEEE